MQRHLRKAVNWAFRSRVTGRIVVGQFPNVALWIFLGAALMHRVLGPAGSVGTWLRVIATAALLWWAVDEVLRGVNPWRRILGGVVLVAQVAGLVR